ncbi:MAG: SMP-30/gluconolactonase/LRE family protein [Planctomycetaceae bacterium]
MQVFDGRPIDLSRLPHAQTALRTGACKPVSTTIIAFLLLAGVVLSHARLQAEPPLMVVPEDAHLEELWNEGEFTEGVAVAPDGMVYFSDIPDVAAGRVLKYNPQTDETSVHCADSGKSNGLAFDPQGRLIAACGANGGRRALCEITPVGNVRPLVERFEGHRFNSPNDLVIHPHGTIFFSDPRYVGAEPVELDHQSVYVFHPRLPSKLSRLDTGITKPNGVMLSPDRKTLYVAETDNGTLDGSQPPANGTPLRMTLNAYELNGDGPLRERRRVLVDFGQQLGIDGMTVDGQGRIYAAVRSNDRFGIRVYSPQGKELAHIATPSLPTNCGFGIGDDATSLYVTAGGGLYRLRLKTAE